MTRDLSAFGVIMAATAAAAAAGSLATVRAPSFYQALERPGWAPPAAVFGPVWTALYALMAVAAWLVWRQRGTAPVVRPLTLYGAQLLFNAAWSWIFFAWRQGGAAVAEIAALLVVVLATTAAFWRVRPLAGALLLPYLGWLGFAAALTVELWRRNAALLGGTP